MEGVPAHRAPYPPSPALSTILARSPVPLPKDLPLRGSGTARRRWKEFPRIARPYPPSRTLSKPLIQPRVQGRNPARFNGGYGIPRGFKGEKSKFPPNPLGLAERVPRIARRLCNRPPSPLPKDLPLRGRGTARRRWKEFLSRTRLKKFLPSTSPGSPAGQNLRFCRRLHIGALRSPLPPFARSLNDTCSFPQSPVPLPKDLPLRGRGTARRRWKEFPPHSVESVYALNPHSILTAYSGCNSFAPKPSIFQPTVEIWSSGSAVPALPAGLTITRGFAPLRLVMP